MRISELEALLKQIREREGDLNVVVGYTDHTDWYYQTPLRKSEVRADDQAIEDYPEFGIKEDEKVLTITMLESLE